MISVLMVNGPHKGDLISKTVEHLNTEIETTGFKTVDYSQGITVHFKCLGSEQDPSSDFQYYIYKQRGTVLTIFGITTPDVNQVQSFVDKLLAA